MIQEDEEEDHGIPASLKMIKKHIVKGCGVHVQTIHVLIDGVNMYSTCSVSYSVIVYSLHSLRLGMDQQVPTHPHQ